MSDSATFVDDMSDNTISHFLVEQIAALRKESRDDAREVREDMREMKIDIRGDIDELKTDVSDVKGDIGDVKEQIGGKDGINVRLTRLEAQAIKNSRHAPAHVTDSSSPPSSKPKKALNKENMVVAGGGVALTTVIYGLIELAKQFLVK